MEKEIISAVFFLAAVYGPVLLFALKNKNLVFSKAPHSWGFPSESAFDLLQKEISLKMNKKNPLLS